MTKTLDNIKAGIGQIILDSGDPVPTPAPYAVTLTFAEWEVIGGALNMAKSVGAGQYEAARASAYDKIKKATRQALSNGGE